MTTAQLDTLRVTIHRSRELRQQADRLRMAAALAYWASVLVLLDAESLHAG